MLLAIAALMTACNVDNKSASQSSNDYENYDKLFLTESTQKQKETKQNNDKESPANIARKIVQKLFDRNARFDMSTEKIDSTTVENRYKVTQKFNSSDNGKNQTYIFSVYVQYYGMYESADIDGWNYGNLEIKNLSTKETEHFDGSMKFNKIIYSGQIEAGGITLNIAEERMPSFIRIYTDKKLKKAQLKKIFKDLNSVYEQIQVSTTEHHERGDEYVTCMGNTIFDFTTGNVVLMDNW